MFTEMYGYGPNKSSNKDEAKSFNQFSLAVLCGSDSLISVFRNFAAYWWILSTEHVSSVRSHFD